MEYATPQLVVVGAATALVQGIPEGFLDNPGSEDSQPLAGTALGLDD